MKIFTAFKVQFSSSVRQSMQSFKKSKQIFKALGIDDIVATHDANIEIEDVEGSDAYVKVKGAPIEVTSVKNMMLDLAKGETSNSLILSPTQREKLNQDEDKEERWERLRKKNNVDLQIDLGQGVISFNGTGKSILNTKKDIYRQLNYLCPGDFESFPLEAEALPFFSLPENLERIRKESGIFDVSVDRQFRCLRINGDMQSNQLAESVVSSILTEWRSLFTYIELENSSIISQLIGKGGKAIAEIENAHKVEVFCDKDNLCAKVKGSNPDDVTKAKDVIVAKIQQIMKENAEIYVTKDLIPAIVGKSGANVKKLKEESGASFDIVRESVPYVKIRGNEEAVAKGKSLLHAFIDEYNENNHLVELDVTPAEYGTVLGKGGSRIKTIEEQANVNIDLVRDKQKVRIRGNPSQVVHARGLIVKLLERKNSINSVGSSSSNEDLSTSNTPSSSQDPHGPVNGTSTKNTISPTTSSLFNWAHETQPLSQTSTLMSTSNHHQKRRKNKKKKENVDEIEPNENSSKFTTSDESSNSQKATSKNINGTSDVTKKVSKPSNRQTSESNIITKSHTNSSGKEASSSSTLSDLLKLSPSAVLSDHRASNPTEKDNKKSNTYVKSSSGVKIRL